MKIWNDLTSDEQMGAILGFLLLVVVGATLGLFFWIAHEVQQDQTEWEAFSAAHSCRKTHLEQSHVAVTTGLGFSASGKAVVVAGPTHIPARVGYLCDDGVTYWRSN